MSELQDKVKLANELGEAISKIKTFIDLCDNGQKVEEEYAKRNELKGVNRFYKIDLEAYICTGSQSPKYEARLYGDDAIKCFVNGGVTALREMLKSKEQELNFLFK